MDNQWRIFYVRDEFFRDVSFALHKRAWAVTADKYKLVDTIDGIEHRLGRGGIERVFRMYNVVEGDERPVQLRVRSMSVGDVVVRPDGEGWICAPIGWVSMTRDELKALEAL